MQGMHPSEKEWRETEYHLKLLGATRRQHSADFFKFFKWFLVYAGKHGVHQLLNSVSNNPSSRDISFVRDYFTHYFAFRRLDHYIVHPLPTPTKPTLLLTTRSSIYSSLFIWSLLPIPFLVPLPETALNLPLHPYVPKWPVLGRKLRHIAIQDQELPEALPKVKKLLNQGYSVIAYINKGHQDRMINDTLQIHSLLHDCHTFWDNIAFCRLDGWEQTQTLTTKTPALISVDFISLKELIEIGKNQNPLKAIGNFFMYTKIKSI